MQPVGLLDALERVPRRNLGTYPTPLVRLENLSRELDRAVYVKRDDALGPAGGGNKTRKLEYLLADAIEAGATKIVTVGGPQSNHARLTAAAARMLGLEPHLLLFGSEPKRAVGNLLLDQLLGAELHFIPPGPIASKTCTFEELDAYVRKEASKRVGDHYHVPLGGSNGLGSVGYVRAALEIEEQTKIAGVADAWIVVATGSGGTLAGLLAGLRLIGSSLRLIGIDVASIWTSYPELVARIANDALELLGLPERVEPVWQGWRVSSSIRPTPVKHLPGSWTFTRLGTLATRTRLSSGTQGACPVCSPNGFNNGTRRQGHGCHAQNVAFWMGPHNVSSSPSPSRIT
jgi:D-cysteine desulfhydrase